MISSITNQQSALNRAAAPNAKGKRRVRISDRFESAMTMIPQNMQALINDTKIQTRKRYRHFGMAWRSTCLGEWFTVFSFNGSGSKNLADAEGLTSDRLNC